MKLSTLEMITGTFFRIYGIYGMWVLQTCSMNWISCSKSSGLYGCDSGVWALAACIIAIRACSRAIAWKQIIAGWFMS